MIESRQILQCLGTYGALRLYVSPQDIGKIDVLEFNPEYIVPWVDKVADSLFTPVCFVVNVYYKNGNLIETFRWGCEVDDINKLTRQRLR